MLQKRQINDISLKQNKTKSLRHAPSISVFVSFLTQSDPFHSFLRIFTPYAAVYKLHESNDYSVVRNNRSAQINVQVGK